MEDPLVNPEPPVAEQRTHPHQAVDHFVFLITFGFVVPPFITWLVLSRSSPEETAFTIFAPFASSLVLIAVLMLIEFLERRVAGSRRAWPPALLGLPVACIVSGLAFSIVDPGHHHWRDGLAGAAWGAAAALIGWRRWRACANHLAPPPPHSAVVPGVRLPRD
jgi:hypothetical protein